ncbi:MAG TPA: hypothetical protein VMZ52_16680 [Bryobacteraceae bacterium]|nr:hypothetical protein [Bryobacteraceae bacterium]
MQGASYEYFFYNVNLRSDHPLALPEGHSTQHPTIELKQGTETFFQERVPAETRADPPGRFFSRRLIDGSSYFHWKNRFEFLMSADYSVLVGRPVGDFPWEGFQTYFLGQMLSFALLGHGIESIHGTTVVIDGQGVSLLGNSAYGKSTLAAAFLQAGHKLLSDDLLVTEEADGIFWALPGIPRIKLYERVSQTLLKNPSGGTPMTQDYPPKMIYRIGPEQFSKRVPLRAMYVLASPKAVAQAQIHEPRIEPIGGGDRFIELIRNSFNAVVATPERLASQFAWTDRLIRSVPVQRLSYPRLMSVLPEVVRMVEADVAKLGKQHSK